MGFFLRSRTRPTPLLDMVINLENDTCVVCKTRIGEGVASSRTWVELGGNKKCCKECYVWNKDRR